MKSYIDIIFLTIIATWAMYYLGLDVWPLNRFAEFMGLAFWPALILSLRSAIPWFKEHHEWFETDSDPDPDFIKSGVGVPSMIFFIMCICLAVQGASIFYSPAGYLSIFFGLLILIDPYMRYISNKKQVVVDQIEK